MARTGLPTVLSTGMATLAEVDDAVRRLPRRGRRAPRAAALHVELSDAARRTSTCARSPRWRPRSAARSGSATTAAAIEAALGAVALGACLIEKHFTLDRELPGPDHWFSATPGGAAALVDGRAHGRAEPRQPAIGPDRDGGAGPARLPALVRRGARPAGGAPARGGRRRVRAPGRRAGAEGPRLARGPRAGRATSRTDTCSPRGLRRLTVGVAFAPVSPTDDVFTSVSRYYDELLARHGDDARSCDYGDPRSQVAKFRVIARRRGHAPGARVLDVGCGLAHFADHLETAGLGVDYVGVDLSPGDGRARPRAAARRSTSARRTSCTRTSASSTSCWPTGSSTCSATRRSTLMRALVERMWAHAERGAGVQLAQHLGPRRRGRASSTPTRSRRWRAAGR